MSELILKFSFNLLYSYLRYKGKKYFLHLFMDAPTRGGRRMSRGTTDSAKDSTIVLQKLEARK